MKHSNTMLKCIATRSADTGIREAAYGYHNRYRPSGERIKNSGLPGTEQ